MEKYPLEPILSVRLYREENAKTALRLAEKMLLDAKVLLKQAKEEVENYLISMPELIEAEYAQIMGKECHLDDIEAVKYQVAVINQGLVDREIEVEKKEQEVKNAEQNLSNAKINVHNARKECAKIETHKNIWKEIEAKETERKEDLEMEDFSVISKED